jgi:glycerophosphoryl diester phosphodiesterase
MKLIAHRGLYNTKKEQNTIKSFLNAINNSKYVGFECDIRQTKDKRFIIHHDAFIENKLIKKTNYKDLKIYNITNLKDVLNLNTNKIILLEIKDFDVDIERINRFLKKYKNKNIYVMSFHNKVLQKLKETNHFYKLGSLNYILNNIDNYPYDFICLLNNFTNSKKIKYYLNNNKEVFIYGIINDNKLSFGNNCFYIVD